MPSILHRIALHKGMLPLQREQARVLTHSHSLLPVAHVPGEPSRPTNHGWCSSSGGFVLQQQQKAAQHHTGHTNCGDQEHGGAQWAAASTGIPVLTPGAFCLPSGLLGPLRHLHFSIEECASSWKKQHNMKCKDYFSNKLNLCCT